MKRIFISSCDEEDYILFEKTLNAKEIEYNIDNDKYYVIQDKDTKEVVSTKVIA